MEAAWTIGIGLLLIVSAVWWVPWRMSRIRARVAERGGAERFDSAVLGSRTYAVVLRGIPILGAILVVWGVVRALT